MERAVTLRALIGVALVGKPGPAERDAATDRARQRLRRWRHPQPAGVVCWLEVQHLSALKADRHFPPGHVEERDVAAFPIGPLMAINVAK